MSRLDSLIVLVSGSTLVAFVGLVAYASLAALGVVGAGAASLEDASGYGAGGASPSASAAVSYPSYTANVDGETREYLDFGNDTPIAGDGSVQIAPIWVFIDGFDDDGSPRMIAGHPSVLDVVPGDAEYSDLWDVQFVLVPKGYDSRAIHSLAELDASGLETFPAGMLVNCPLVEDGATTAEGHELRSGWYRGKLMYYFTLGLSSTTPGDLYEFVVEGAAGGYGTAEPSVPSVSPLLILPSVEGPDAQFFRVHQVTVPDASTAEHIRTLADLEASGFPVRSTGDLANRPLLED